MLGIENGAFKPDPYNNKAEGDAMIPAIARSDTAVKAADPFSQQDKGERSVFWVWWWLWWWWMWW
jgi:hypothetical protein